jgi:hypothetical protein
MGQDKGDPRRKPGEAAQERPTAQLERRAPPAARANVRGGQEDVGEPGGGSAMRASGHKIRGLGIFIFGLQTHPKEHNEKRRNHR